MKQSIIKTCDIIAYLLFAFVFVTTAFTALTGNILHALMFLVIGWVIASLISGVWFCLSQTAANSAETNKLLKQLINNMEK